MKKLLLVCCLSVSLCSCSLLQRHGDSPDEDSAEAAQAPATEGADADQGPLFTPNGQEVSAESEVSRLSTKVAALETKLDVLSSNLERLQAQKAQPIIQAEPQANLAAPVDESSADAGEIQTRAKEVSAAPARTPRHLPSATKEPVNTVLLGDDSSKLASAAEREFRAGMELFQNGQNLEASSRFALMARKFPHHMLAAHALYWAGEAAARAQQWSIATEDWADLEKNYPRSAYMPEALAGLAKAYEAQGDSTKARLYRSLLQRAFPKSPVAMKSGTEQPAASSAMAAPAGASNDEAAPLFEDDSVSGTSAAPTQGSGAETQ